MNIGVHVSFLNHYSLCRIDLSKKKDKILRATPSFQSLNKHTFHSQDFSRGSFCILFFIPDKRVLVDKWSEDADCGEFHGQRRLADYSPWGHRVRHDWVTVAVTAKSFQSCLTLCDHIDGSPPGSPGPGILQARTLEWVAISFSNAWKWKMKGKSLSCVQLFATPWASAYQAPPSMGFSRQEYWSVVPLPSPN